MTLQYTLDKSSVRKFTNHFLLKSDNKIVTLNAEHYCTKTNISSITLESIQDFQKLLISEFNN